MNPPISGTYGLQPTYEGFVVSTFDALILFEACLRGRIHHVSRRPQERERGGVIRSGNIFIYEENTSGIKRWTDGVSWSPSRILSNFLIYRQLEKAFPPGEKKKAKKPTATIKSPGKPIGVTKIGSPKKSNINPAGLERALPMGPPPLPSPRGSPTTQSERSTMISTLDIELERSLVGSLTDSYDFMDGGLVKKTISVTIGDITHHLVSYYTVADALIRGKFQVPAQDPRFAGMLIRNQLLDQQSFRSSPREIDILERAIYVYLGGYETTPMPTSFLGTPGFLSYPFGGNPYQQPSGVIPVLPSAPMMHRVYDNSPRMDPFSVSNGNDFRTTNFADGENTNGNQTFMPVPPPTPMMNGGFDNAYQQRIDSFSISNAHEFHVTDFSNSGNVDIHRSVTSIPPPMRESLIFERPGSLPDQTGLDMPFAGLEGQAWFLPTPDFPPILNFDPRDEGNYIEGNPGIGHGHSPSWGGGPPLL